MEAKDNTETLSLRRDQYIPYQQPSLAKRVRKASRHS